MTNLLDAKLRDLAADRDKAFQTWFERPETKLIISLLPPLETEMQRDCFHTLLQGAFRVGHESGQSSIAALMLEGMTKATPRGQC